MDPLTFVLALTFLFTILLVVSFKYLPRERWQIIASVPLAKRGQEWTGINLTFYGFFSATAYALGAALALVLLGAADVSLYQVGLLVVALLGITVPASRWVAQLVEGKKETFSVGGAVFVGMLVTPFVVMGLNRIDLFERPLPIIATLSALMLAYTIGEGLGRLACISFGCCYGKPISELGPWGRRLFGGRRNFRFEGKTRKIAFASGLDGVAVVPIQAVTAILYLGCALLGTYWFLLGYYGLALVVATVFTQLWRVYSEFLRADYRGERKFSAYQWMALVGAAYTIGVYYWLRSEGAIDIQLAQGLRAFWRPEVVISCQLLWLLIFLYMGMSKVTGSALRFHVREENLS